MFFSIYLPLNHYFKSNENHPGKQKSQQVQKSTYENMVKKKLISLNRNFNEVEKVIKLKLIKLYALENYLKNEIN